jgi:exonuclease III
MRTWQQPLPTTDFAPRPAVCEIGVLTWNVQHAAPSRAARQAAWIASQRDADIVVLTEVAGGASGEALLGELAGHGYAGHLPDGDGDFRAAIASRLGDIRTIAQLRPGFLPHRWITAEVALPGGPTFAVAGVYVPSRGPQSRRNVAKRTFQDAAAALLPVLSEQLPLPILVAGDLNVVEPDHRPHHSVFGGWEYDFYRAFGSAGFTDCFRAMSPDTHDHSWYGRSGNGYRFDHIFVSARHAGILTGCWYDHTPRLRGLSDHAALLATIRLSSS